MTLLDIIALLLTLSALFGYANHKWLKLPHTIGLVVIGLAASATIVLADFMFTGLSIGDTVRGALNSIDFHEALMHGFLSALLFAGAIHIDLAELASRKWAISLMATLGVLLSTFIIAGVMSLLGGVLGVELPFIWWLVFGSLISPTDPVAVLGILKTVRVPPLLQAKIAGESLFNDGVGVVVFTVMLAIAGVGGHGPIGVIEIAELFIFEAVGGAVLGLVAGYIAYQLMRSLDEHNLEVMITLALVTGGYALALKLHVSGPIAMVVAGLLIGNHGARFAMSENTRKAVFDFWNLSDEILNSVLFLLIGLEVLVIGVYYQYAGLALLAIPIVLLARFISVGIPIKLLSLREKFTEGAITILTWGGLRGGISVALALSLPNNEYKPVILATTYAVVVFSIIVQGLTMQKLVKRTIVEARTEDPSALKED
jgi:Na+:H+ antiporter